MTINGPTKRPFNATMTPSRMMITNGMPKKTRRITLGLSRLIAKVRILPSLNSRDQQTYWNWRHDHSDAQLKIEIK